MLENDSALRTGGRFMPIPYEIGDIVRLKKQHPWMGNTAGRSRFSFKMFGLRTSDYGFS